MAKPATNVRSGSKAEIVAHQRDVRFTPNTGHHIFIRRRRGRNADLAS
jgi:hypothetical protein